MADDKTRSLLEQWGVGCLESIFKEHCIDIEALRLLNEDDLNKLILSIGLLTKFRENWKIWLAENTDANKDKYNNQCLDLLDISDCVTPQNIQQTNIPEISTTVTPQNTQQANAPEIATATTCQNIRNNLDVILNPNYVLNVLQQSVDGRALIATGNRSSGLLKEAQRKELGRIIIKHILSEEPSKKIQSVVFTQLSLQIAENFQKESAALYFTSSLSATKYQKKKNASGILYEAYISRRRKLRNIGVLSRGTARSRSSSTSRSTKSDSRDEDGDAGIDTALEDNPILEEHLNWLANSIEPWSLVELYWRETTFFRLKEDTDKKSISEYFKRFPALRQHQGFTLLLHDFSWLYPNIANDLFSSLVLVREKILELAQERMQSSRDREYRKQVENYICAATDGSQKGNLISTLLLLPYLLNIPPGIKKTGKPVWKPSRSEIRDAFITQLPTDAEILPTIEARKNKYQELGRSFQPLIIIIGPSLKAATRFVVVIDDTLYDFSTGIEAVDGAFKIFHATGACYPEEATDVWLFIQRAFYKIETKYDRLSQAIRHLTSDLGLPL